MTFVYMGYNRAMNVQIEKEDAQTIAQRELISSQFSLFAYICALVGDAHDAQDVLQETNLKMFPQLASYDVTRPFLPWAKSIAYYQVLSYRTRRSRERLVLAEDSFFDLVAADAETAFDDVGDDMAHLERCLRKLKVFVRELIESRYVQGLTVNELARERHCSANAVSLLLFKARRSLCRCIQEGRLHEVSV